MSVNNRQKIAENLPTDNDGSWYSNHLRLMMIAVSVVWCAIILIYITKFFAWSNLFSMVPDEFGVFLASIALPLPIIWLIMTFVDRERSFKREARFLRAYMNQLVYPDEGGAETSKAMSDAIRTQVAELREVASVTMEQTEVIKKELSSRVEDFTALVKALDSYSTKSMVELTSGVKTLTSSFDGISDKAAQTTKELSRCMDEFSKAAEHLQTDVGGIMQQLIPGIKEMKTSVDNIQEVANVSTQKLLEVNGTLKNYGDNTTEKFSTVVDNLQNQGRYLEEVCEKAMANTKNVGEQMQNISADIDNMLKQQTQKVGDYATSLEKNIREAYKNISEQGEQISGEVERIINRSSVVGENITSQVADLKNMAEEITVSLDNVGVSLSDKIGVLDNCRSEALDNLQKVVEAFADNSEKLQAVAVDNTAKVSGLFADNTAKIQSMAEDNVQKVSGLFNDNTAKIQSLSEDNVQKVSGLFDDNTAKMQSMAEDNVQKVSGLFADNTAKINEFAEDSVRKADKLFSDNAERLRSISESMLQQTETCNSSIGNRQVDIRNFAEQVYASIDGISTRFEDSFSRIKHITEDLLQQFTLLHNNLSEQGNQLSTTGELVAKQSQEAENSLRLQNEYINNSISSIEANKNDLQRQIDELSQVAENVAQDVNNAVANLKDRLNESVDVSNSVVAKTNEINVGLEQSAEHFVASTGATIDKITGLGDVISAQNDKFNLLLSAVEAKTEKVAEALDKHQALVAQATDNSDKKLQEILSAFASQSTSLTHISEDAIAHVSEVAQMLEEKATNIGIVFRQQQNEFLELCDKISAHTDSLGASVKEQLISIENNTDTVFAKMTDMENTAKQQAEAIVAQSGISINQLGEIDTVINERSLQLENQIATILAQTTKVADDFTSNIRSFGELLNEVKNHSNETTSTILQNTDKIKAVNSDFAQDVQNFVGRFENHLQLLDSGSAKLVEQSTSIENSFNHHKGILADVANDVTTQTRLGEASMSKQRQYMQEITADIETKMKELSDNLALSMDNIYKSAGKIAGEVNALGEQIVKVGDTIDTTSQNSIKNIEDVHRTLGQCSADMENYAGTAVGTIGAAVSNYEQYLSGFNQATNEAGSEFLKINQQISEQNDRMHHISQDTRALADYFNGILAETADKLTEKANFANDKVQGVSEGLKGLGQQLATSSEDSSKLFEKSSDILRSAIVEIMANAERINTEIKTAEEAFNRQSGELTANAENTLTQISTVMNDMSSHYENFNNKSAEIVANTGNFNGVLQKQIELLDIGAKKASRDLLDIEKKYREAKVDTFLSSAAGIIERLETLAVDINAVFNAEAQEKLWQKYYEGDTDAFVRYLAKNMTRKQVVAIKEEFEKNSEFRKAVTAYMSEFESLINRARSCDKSSVLLSVMSGADIGKIYYILARALDKLN